MLRAVKDPLPGKRNFQQYWLVLEEEREVERRRDCDKLEEHYPLKMANES